MCGKMGGMECGSNEECYNNNCKFAHNTYCMSNSRMNFTMKTKKFILSVVFGIALLL